MNILNYCQPLGCVTQSAYIVPDNQATMKQLTELLTAGPWFVAGPFVSYTGHLLGDNYTSFFNATVILDGLDPVRQTRLAIPTPTKPTAFIKLNTAYCREWRQDHDQP